MDRKLYNWLERQFYLDNHNKYRKYFKEWVDKLVPSQVKGFRDQMIRQENKTNIVST